MSYVQFWYDSFFGEFSIWFQWSFQRRVMLCQTRQLNWIEKTVWIAYSERVTIKIVFTFNNEYGTDLKWIDASLRGLIWVLIWFIQSEVRIREISFLKILVHLCVLLNVKLNQSYPKTIKFAIINRLLRSQLSIELRVRLQLGNLTFEPGQETINRS